MLTTPPFQLYFLSETHSRTISDTVKGMPTLTHMRAKGKKIEQAIGSPKLSAEEKEKKKKEKEEKQSEVAPWLVGLLMFVVLGSSIVQIYFSIQHSPSMSEEH